MEIMGRSIDKSPLRSQRCFVAKGRYNCGSEGHLQRNIDEGAMACKKLTHDARGILRHQLGVRKLRALLDCKVTIESDCVSTNADECEIDILGLSRQNDALSLLRFILANNDRAWHAISESVRSRVTSRPNITPP
jgi:hypothetical protein